MKTACVTGATGCVGRNLVEELLSNDWDVIVLHRRSSDLSRLRGCAVRFQEVDLADLESVRAGIPANLDALFHVAGNTSHWAAEAEQQWRDNVLTTRNLVQVALEKQVSRFIFTSTGATQAYQHWDEQQVMRIKNGYVRTKMQAELEVYKGVERGLYAVVLRPIIVIGRYDYNSYAQIFANMKSSPVKLAFPGKGVFCHASDVARAHVQAYERGRNCERYVLGGTCTTWLEAFRLICSRVGARPATEAPLWVLRLASYFMAAVAWLTKKKPLLTPELMGLLSDFADVSYPEARKAREDLGYESRPLAVMIEDCYGWLVQEGRI